MIDKYYENNNGEEKEITQEEFQAKRKKDVQDFLFKIKCNESFPKVKPYDLKLK